MLTRDLCFLNTHLHSSLLLLNLEPRQICVHLVVEVYKLYDTLELFHFLLLALWSTLC